MAESMEDEVKEICKFLEPKGIGKEVIENFHKQKMGFDAVYLASDNQLQDELGIKELGVRLSLKAHCERLIKKQKDTKLEKEKEERKRRLLEEIVNPKKSKATASKQEKQIKTSRNQRPVSRNVLFGWIHCSNDKKPRRVGLEKGGGTRQLSATTETTYEELIKAGKAWFFPNGMSQFGEEKEMTFGLADFQRETLKKEEDGVAFTVGNYAEKNGFKSRIRVYLTSQIIETLHSDSDIESEDESEGKPLLKSETNTDVFPVVSVQSDDDQVVETFTSFIETNNERDILIREQDQEYLESLRNDQKKDEERRLLLEKELNDVERQESLRSIRESRLLPEPDVSEDHVLVSVRHMTQGIITRAFYPGSSIIQLYDWVGSLQLVPEHYKLVSPISGKLWLPEDRVDDASKSILNMIECDEPLQLLADDNGVNTAGFSMLNETLPCATPPRPHVLHGETDEALQDQGESTSVEENPPHESIWNHSAFACNFLEKTATISIHRLNVVETLMKLYSEQEFCKTLPQFNFQGESAQDLDGPKRAVYNIFWDEIFKMHFEGANAVVPRFGPDMCDDLVTLFGRVALHGYICSGMFPTRISKIFIKAMMFGENSIEQDELVQGLLEFVTDHERQFLSQCMRQSSYSEEEKEELLEIVAQFGVRSIPSPETLYDHLVRIGRCELLRKSMWAFRPFQKGITDAASQDPIWANPSDIDVFYDELSVTAEKVSRLTHVDDEASLTKSQATVFAFLRRYIKACNNEKIKVLYRFFTGSDH